MAAENAAEVAALRGWRVYFNTITLAGRRNVRFISCSVYLDSHGHSLLQLVIATWGSIFGLIWLNKKRRQRKARKAQEAQA